MKIFFADHLNFKGLVLTSDLLYRCTNLKFCFIQSEKSVRLRILYIGLYVQTLVENLKWYIFSWFFGFEYAVQKLRARFLAILMEKRLIISFFPVVPKMYWFRFLSRDYTFSFHLFSFSSSVMVGNFVLVHKTLFFLISGCLSYLMHFHAVMSLDNNCYKILMTCFQNIWKLPIYFSTPEL